MCTKKPYYSFLIALLLLATNDCRSQDCSTFYSDSSYITIFPSPCDTPQGAIIAHATGGMPPYEYTIDGYPVGLQDNSLFDAIYPGDYIVSIMDLQGCVVHVPVNVPSNRHDAWVGSMNSEWELQLNWSPKLIPSPCSDVVIDSGQIIINSNVTVNSLTLNNGAKVIVDSGFNLTVLH
jgi:hypothetical protein